jgi:hypothetical protein
MFKCFKKRSKININMYTTNFPTDGWIFECFECNCPTGNMIVIKDFEVYICRGCLRKIKLNKKYKKDYYKNFVEINKNTI